MIAPPVRLGREEILLQNAKLQKTVERQEREIAEQRARIEDLKQQLVQKDTRIAELEADLAKARKNSRNSSKPPSSDITKPPGDPKRKGDRRKKRKIGGQEGHPKHESGLTLANADHVVHLNADRIPHEPSRELVPAPDQDPKIIFQYEMVKKPIELTAYVAHPYRDPNTGDVLFAPFSTEVEAAGILGPRLTAFAACLKGGIHASYSGTEKVLGFLGVDVCRSTLCNKTMKVSAALAFAHGELLDALPEEKFLNVDETGHKDNPFQKPPDHPKHWIWVFVASTFTVFKIFGKRSTDVLREVLGTNCEAILGSDFYSVYKCFMKVAHIKVQFCWAHLIRDIRFLSESNDKVTANYGRRLLKLCKLIFHLHHRRKELGEEKFRRKMQRLKDKFLATGRRSQASGAQNMVVRLRDYGEDYFLFLANPHIEPTNNLAEREERSCVIDRRITQGTRGTAGQRWCERIWTVLATCARQKRDGFAFVAKSLYTFYAGQPQPSLLPKN
jgi:transposase